MLLQHMLHLLISTIATYNSHTTTQTHISCSLPYRGNHNTNQDTYKAHKNRIIDHNLLQLKLWLVNQLRNRLRRLHLQSPKFNYNTVKCLLQLLQFCFQVRATVIWCLLLSLQSVFLCFQLHILHLMANVTTRSWITLHSKHINQSSSKRHSEVTNVKNPYLDVVRALKIPLAQSRRLLALDPDQWNMAKEWLTTAATRCTRARRG